MSRRELQQTASLRDYQSIAGPARAVAVSALLHPHAKNETAPNQPKDNQHDHDVEPSP